MAGRQLSFAAGAQQPERSQGCACPVLRARLPCWTLPRPFWLPSPLICHPPARPLARPPAAPPAPRLPTHRMEGSLPTIHLPSTMGTLPTFTSWKPLAPRARLKAPLALVVGAAWLCKGAHHAESHGAHWHGDAAPSPALACAPSSPSLRRCLPSALGNRMQQHRHRMLSMLFISHRLPATTHLDPKPAGQQARGDADGDIDRDAGDLWAAAYSKQIVCSTQSMCMQHILKHCRATAEAGQAGGCSKRQAAPPTAPRCAKAGTTHPHHHARVTPTPQAQRAGPAHLC